MNKKPRKKPDKVTVTSFNPVRHFKPSILDEIGEGDDNDIIMFRPPHITTKDEHVLIDCKTWTNALSMHQHLQQELHFSPDYGCNLDALFDAINATRYRLTLINTAVPLHHMGQYFGRTLLVLEDADALEDYYEWEIRQEIEDYISVDDNVGGCPDSGFRPQQTLVKKEMPPDEPVF